MGETVPSEPETRRLLQGLGVGIKTACAVSYYMIVVLQTLRYRGEWLSFDNIPAVNYTHREMH